jgi:hypothetical protein
MLKDLAQWQTLDLLCNWQRHGRIRDRFRDTRSATLHSSYNAIAYPAFPAISEDSPVGSFPGSSKRIARKDTVYPK